MRLFILAALLIAAVTNNTKSMAQTTIYDFKVEKLDGGVIDFAQFKGKKILIVNTASECGFTPQYAKLQELYESKKDELIIVGFPANNFGGQEPGSNDDIKAFCEKNFGVSFPMTVKVSVKGEDIHPMFDWMNGLENPDFTGDIKWNFEKYLFDEEGNLLHRYRSTKDPMKLL